MTREEAIKWLKDIHHRFNPTGENLENEGGDVHLQALDMAIEALKENNRSDSFLTDRSDDCKESESKLDLISRQAAIEAIARDIPFITFTEDPKRTAQRIIGTVPSAEPKTGKWVKRQTIGDVSFAYCSECGEPILHGRTSPLWNFCPNCGAKMYKDGDDEWLLSAMRTIILNGHQLKNKECVVTVATAEQAK